MPAGEAGRLNGQQAAIDHVIQHGRLIERNSSEICS
jgi:hypothetical protein